MSIVDELRREGDTSAPADAAEWRDALAAYATTLEAQRAYLEAVASGASDAEPPAPFEVPAGLPASSSEIRGIIADLHTATIAVLAEYADLPDRLERPIAGIAIARRTTTTTVSVLDRAL